MPPVAASPLTFQEVSIRAKRIRWFGSFFCFCGLQSGLHLRLSRVWRLYQPDLCWRRTEFHVFGFDLPAGLKRRSRRFSNYNWRYTGDANKPWRLVL